MPLEVNFSNFDVPFGHEIAPIFNGLESGDYLCALGVRGEGIQYGAKIFVEFLEEIVGSASG